MLQSGVRAGGNYRIEHNRVIIYRLCRSFSALPQIETPKLESPVALRLTDLAALRLQSILAADDRSDAGLRIYVSGGGCSGFRYCFEVDDQPQEDDLHIATAQGEILIDSLSLPYLTGAILDYREDLEGSRFVIDNPNAVTTCGCGESFSI